MFGYTVRHTASVYILLLAIYIFVASLKKKGSEKNASYVIKTLARIVLECDFIFTFFFNEMVLLKVIHMACVLLFYFALPIVKSAHHGKVTSKTTMKTSCQVT